MKRLTVILLCFMMVLFAGCTNKGATDTPPSKDVSPSAALPENTDEPTKPGNENGGEVTPADVWDAITAEFDGELPIFMDVDDEMLEMYYGFDSSILLDSSIHMPMMIVAASEIFIARVSPENLDTVKAGFDKRLADLDNTWSSYLIDQHALVQDARIVENGEFIMLCISKHADGIVDIFNEMTI